MQSVVLRGALAAAFVVSLLSPSTASACSVCGCGDPLVTAGDAMPVRGNFRFAIEAEYLTAEAAGEAIESPTGGHSHDGEETLAQFSLRPVAVYSPVDSVNLVLQIPLVRKAWAVTGAEPLSANTLGLGDVDVGARWFLWRDTNFSAMRRQNLALSLGTSLPTGSIDAQLGGERLDDHAQLGTGGWGPYAGLLYAFHQDPWNVSVNLSGRTHTENAEGYRYGMAMLWSVRGTYRVLDSLAFSFSLDGRWAQRDFGEGDWVGNSGGTVLALTPEIRGRITGELWARATAQLPVYTALFGHQTVGPVFLVGFQYSFKS